MDKYRLTRPDELNSQFPLVRDHRPRLCIPIVEALPPMGRPSPAWARAAAAGPFHYPLDIARLIASAVGREVWSAADDPAVLVPADPALQTSVRLMAWKHSGRNIQLRARFECREPEMARIRAAADPAQKDPLQPDYVALLVNLDRIGDKVIEIGVNCRGETFLRPYTPFISAHNCEPTLGAGRVTPLGAGPASPDDQKAFEDRHPRGPRGDAVRACVWYEKDAWFAELEIPFNMFGDYADPGIAYPANFIRARRAPVHGAPGGIAWRATVNAFTWAPVRWQVDEFDKAGFLALGDAPAELIERQVRVLDSELGMARIRRRAAFVARRADSHEVWRNAVNPRTLDTQWLLKAVPGFEFIERGFVLNNSRQLLTLDDGRTLVLAEDKGRLTLAVAAREIDPVSTSFDAVISLLGEGGIFDGRVKPSGEISHASMTRDAAGRLHLIFAEGERVWHAVRSAPDSWRKLGSAASWRLRKLPVKPGVKPYDLERLGGGIAAVLADASERMWTMPLAGRGAPKLLPFEGRCPVLARAARGGLHLAFEFNATIYYVKLADSLAPEGEPEIAAYAPVLFPAMIEQDGRPLIVFQYLGLQKAAVAPEIYIAERERTGCGIGCASPDESGHWRHQEVQRSHEVAVRRMNPTQYMLDMVRHPHNGRVFLMPDENWRPCIGRDGAGVVRAAWQNTTRTQAFIAQWNGRSFNRAEELAGPLPAATPHVSLEKYSGDARALKWLLAAECKLLAGAQSLRAFQPERSPEIYFLDETAVQRRAGVCWSLNPLQRYEGNPILVAPDSGRGNGRDGLSTPQIIRADSGLYLAVVGQTGRKGPLCATSADGLRWEIAAPEDIAEKLSPSDRRRFKSLHASTLSEGSVSFGQRVFKDVLEKDPSRRFKTMVIEGEQIDPYSPRRVLYSPDGVRWTKGPAAVDNNHLNETHLPNIYDTWDRPERRFKIYGRTTTPQGRTLAMLWSGDMVHWHGNYEAVVREAPFSRQEARPSAAIRWGHVLIEGGASLGESEHYYCMPWLEGGLYFLLYAVLCADGHKAWRLAFSRDGFQFKRVGDDWLMYAGAPGGFDSGSLDAPCILPVGDEVRVYYTATGEKHGSLPHTAQHCLGLASTERKRWSFFHRQPGAERGEIVSVPFDAKELRGRGLTVNLSGCAQVMRPLVSAHSRGIHSRADFGVEVLDAATGRALKGFGASDCDALVDGFDNPVTWNGAPLRADRAVQLRFLLSGERARFYSFAFPESSRK